MKNILVVSYCQTGQLDKIVNSIISPLKNDEFNVVTKTIKPLKDYPYPWGVINFMDTFPESNLLIPCDIEPLDDDISYDLIILAYQVWFLSPSIPITSFLKSSYAKEKLKNKPVITIIGCRNMWIKAQEKVKMMLENLEAKLIDNIVLTDQCKSYATFITTPRWLLSGKKDSFLGIFPEAGVSKEDIKNASRFGFAIANGLKNDKEKNYVSLCEGLKACEVNARVINSEKIGDRSFAIWGNLIRKVGLPGDKKRVAFVMIYLVFLCFMILTIVPLNMLISSILRRLNPKKIQKLQQFYSLPSGSENYKMKTK